MTCRVFQKKKSDNCQVDNFFGNFDTAKSVTTRLTAIPLFFSEKVHFSVQINGRMRAPAILPLKMPKNKWLIVVTLVKQSNIT